MSRHRCVSSCLASLVALLLGAAPALAHGPDVRAWRTTGDQASLPVVNDDCGTTTQRFTVSAGGRSFSYELPAGAVATFVLA